VHEELNISKNQFGLIIVFNIIKLIYNIMKRLWLI